MEKWWLTSDFINKKLEVKRSLDSRILMCLHSIYFGPHRLVDMYFRHMATSILESLQRSLGWMSTETSSQSMLHA
jgi:hypothetical protein